MKDQEVYQIILDRTQQASTIHGDSLDLVHIGAMVDIKQIQMQLDIQILVLEDLPEW